MPPAAFRCRTGMGIGANLLFGTAAMEGLRACLWETDTNIGRKENHHSVTRITAQERSRRLAKYGPTDCHKKVGSAAAGSSYRTSGVVTSCSIQRRIRWQCEPSQCTRPQLAQPRNLSHHSKVPGGTRPRISVFEMARSGSLQTMHRASGRSQRARSKRLTISSAWRRLC